MLPSRLIPPPFDSGSVWLVGAGPGDPGLLTLHAAHALAQADIVLHDALVSEEILSLAPQAVLEAAGKRAGGERTPQLRINHRLVQLARQGLRVVRLKGGDPLVFGRGGEEALALVAAGIPFRIVPGISAGIGGTASAGIPVTHRGLARSVAFATGHDSSGDLSDIDWASLSRGAEVLVLYMAQRQTGAIAERLMAAGRAPGEAVALISDATTPRQSVIVTTLAEAAQMVAGACAAMGANEPRQRPIKPVIPGLVPGTNTGTGPRPHAAPGPRNKSGDDGVERHAANFYSTSIPTAGAPLLIVIGPVVALRPMLASLQQTEPMTLRAEPRHQSRNS